jgi:hypothetical protein
MKIGFSVERIEKLGGQGLQVVIAEVEVLQLSEAAEGMGQFADVVTIVGQCGKAGISGDALYTEVQVLQVLVLQYGIWYVAKALAGVGGFGLR